MQYSPKLKVAMDEVKDVLKKYDIAGFVVLHTPGYSEYLNHLATSYSAVQVVPGGLKIVINQAEVGKDKARQLAQDTYNLVSNINTVIQRHAPMYDATHKILKQKWNAIEFDGGHTSYEEQNN